RHIGGLTASIGTPHTFFDAALNRTSAFLLKLKAGTDVALAGLFALLALCLGEPLRSPSRSRPQQCPYIGNKSSQPVCCNSRNIAPMSSAPKPVTNLQQPPFSFSFFHLPFASDPEAPQKIACNIINNAAGPSH